MKSGKTAYKMGERQRRLLAQLGWERPVERGVESLCPLGRDTKPHYYYYYKTCLSCKNMIYKARNYVLSQFVVFIFLAEAVNIFFIINLFILVVLVL